MQGMQKRLTRLLYSPTVITIAATIAFLVLFSLTALWIFSTFLMPAYIESNHIVKVPPLIGLPLAKAEDTLQALHLVPAVTASYYSDLYPEGSVIAQLPYPETEVKEGRKIYLTISRGKLLPKMPYLVGLRLPEAKAMLLRFGLKIDSLQFVHIDTVAPSTVVAHNIPPSTPVTPDSSIILTVNLEKSITVVVPNLVGLPQVEAEKQLVYHRLRIGALRYEVDHTFLPGTVIDQYPRPGDTVRRYTPVSLVIAVE